MVLTFFSHLSRQLLGLLGLALLLELTRLITTQRKSLLALPLLLLDRLFLPFLSSSLLLDVRLAFLLGRV